MLVRQWPAVRQVLATDDQFGDGRVEVVRQRTSRTRFARC
ncbi:hypothetical protein K701_19220 [Streptomyces fradiae ATCC 10745 = DSM 40063]|uniref:Uncharacterized protein n=1 Tax=Streptomyces fradiae ATCC 10745 = DSM 40063 TaxID=1319510 RepID=A0ABQ6XR08_STRFR|nr:hypothetical protein K701_19220 [Streptomyces fradiae ATCC 10745 = DSM 40063]